MECTGKLIWNVNCRTRRSDGNSLSGSLAIIISTWTEFRPHPQPHCTPNPSPISRPSPHPHHHHTHTPHLFCFPILSRSLYSQCPSSLRTRFQLLPSELHNGRAVYTCGSRLKIGPEATLALLRCWVSDPMEEAVKKEESVYRSSALCYLQLVLKKKYIYIYIYGGGGGGGALNWHQISASEHTGRLILCMPLGYETCQCSRLLTHTWSIASLTVTADFDCLTFAAVLRMPLILLHTLSDRSELNLYQ